jgi:hypothetical protein
LLLLLFLLLLLLLFKCPQFDKTITVRNGDHNNVQLKPCTNLVYASKPRGIFIVVILLYYIFFFLKGAKSVLCLPFLKG